MAVSPILEPSPLPTATQSTNFLPRMLLLALLAISLGFALPLRDLLRLSLQSDLFSHIVLIPFVSAYLIWLRRAELPAASAPHRSLAVVGDAIFAGSMGGSATAFDDQLRNDK